MTISYLHKYVGDTYMFWKICPIESYLDDIKLLFSKNADNKHADNYLKEPLFEYTKFARLGFDPHLVYYSAGAERPQYNGSIRILTRHTRDRNYDWGSIPEDRNRGIETLDSLTDTALDYGYKHIWMSREESPKLLEYFCKHSKYNWKLEYKLVPATIYEQYIITMESKK